MKSSLDSRVEVLEEKLDAMQDVLKHAGRYIQHGKYLDAAVDFLKQKFQQQGTTLTVQELADESGFRKQNLALARKKIGHSVGYAKIDGKWVYTNAHLLK